MVTDLSKSLILQSKRSGSICLEYFLLRASSLPGAARAAVLALKKKSFFKLIQSKYDVKMKEKLEKKDKESQLKANNSKKSDEALCPRSFATNTPSSEMHTVNSL